MSCRVLCGSVLVACGVGFVCGAVHVRCNRCYVDGELCRLLVGWLLSRASQTSCSLCRSIQRLLVHAESHAQPRAVICKCCLWPRVSAARKVGRRLDAKGLHSATMYTTGKISKPNNQSRLQHAPHKYQNCTSRISTVGPPTPHSRHNHRLPRAHCILAHLTPPSSGRLRPPLR